MVKKIKTPSFAGNKTFWEVLLALLFIVFFIFFIKNEHLEIASVGKEVFGARAGYIFLGLVVTGLYIFLQALLYIYSFKTICQKISLSAATILFLKRNLVSVFIPAGTFSSLTFFNKDLEKQNLTRTQAFYGSYLFAVASLISVIVVALPVLAYLFVKQSVGKIEIWAFVVLIAIVILLAYVVYSFVKKGLLYRIVRRRMPAWIVILEEIQSQSFRLRVFIQTCIISVLIELTGILHLYIAMLALGMEPSISASIAGYVVMVLLLSVSPFLRGLGAIEISMTYLLVQYGYSLLDSASITLLFRFFEFWVPLVAGLFIILAKKGNILIRVLPVIIIFSLGVINIVSALTPAIPSRIHLVETFLSSDITEISNYTVLVFGIVLIVLSIYLFKGAKNAWRAALILSFASVIGHLVKAIDFEEASIALVAFISLIINRKSYFVRHDITFQRRNFSNVLIALLAMYIYTTVGFYFLHKHNFGIDFNLKESLVVFFKIFVLFETSVLVPQTLFAKGFIFSLYLSGGAILIYTLYILFRPSKKEIATPEDINNLAEKLVKDFGTSSLDYFKTYPDKLLFFSKAQDGFLSYRNTEKYAVVLEAPVGSEESLKQTIIEFEAYCINLGLKTFYYRVAEDNIQMFLSLKMNSLKIGQEAIVSLVNFSLSGKEMKPVRNAINKTSESGFTFHVYKPPIKGGFIQKLELVSNEWLKENGREEIAFTQGVFNEDLVKKCTIVTVEDTEEKVVAFANIIPAYAPGEATYDMLRKTTDAPNGVLDFLMVNLFEYFKNEGYQTVNLGLAPLAGIDKAENFNERVIKFMKDNLRQTSRFKGLYNFKDKFDPIWKNKYLVYDEAYDLIQFPAVLNDVSNVSI